MNFGISFPLDCEVTHARNILIRRKKLENLRHFASITSYIGNHRSDQEITRFRRAFNRSFMRSDERRVTKERPFASSPRLCVASIRRHGNKLYARDRKASTPSRNLANGKLQNGRNRAYLAHGSRPRLFIRNFALIRQYRAKLKMRK